MTSRWIYLANAYVTGALGVALCFAGFGTHDISGAVLIALALIVERVGHWAEIHFLRFAAGHFAAAYMIAAIASMWIKWPSPNPWTVVLLFAMGQAFTFESVLECRGIPLFKGFTVPNPKSAGEVRVDWQEDIRRKATQQERNRLAQDLHDSVKQQLFSIQANLATAQARWESDMPAVQEAIGQARGAAREAFAEISGMLDQLQPSPLESVGLVEALRRQCEALAHRSGADVKMHFHDVPLLDAATQTVVYRIGQEALANVGRHARAQHIEVDFGPSSDEGECLLRIHDDEQGLRPADFPSGEGLRNMTKRAAEIGGMLTVASTPGQGCTVGLRFRPSAYAMDQRKSHARMMRMNWLSAIPFIVCVAVGRGQSPYIWMFASFGLMESAAAVYHTRQYLKWKGLHA